jgi:hypothetical protein
MLDYPKDCIIDVVKGFMSMEENPEYLAKTRHEYDLSNEDVAEILIYLDLVKCPHCEAERKRLHAVD